MVWRPRRTDETFAERLARGDTYVLLTLLLLAYYFTLSLVPLNRGTRVLVTGMGALTLLLALHTSHVHPRFLRIAAIASAVAMTLSTIELLADEPLFSGSSSAIVALLLFTTPVVILRRILRHRRVDIETIAGAVDVYLLLGIIFGLVYMAMNDLGDAAFFQQLNDPEIGDFLYFSFTALTTVGFGNLTPGTDLGQALSVLESVMGSIFLVTLVARLVSLFGTERPTNPTDGNQEDA